jgi:uncharacterized protein YgiM (DUF1202 family)
MSSVGFPIFVVTTLLAGTAAAIVLMPEDVLRSAVVEAPAPSYVADIAAPASPAIRPAAEPAPVVQMASLTVEVTPLSEPQPVAPAPVETRDIRRITAGVLNMRSEPDKYSELIASLPRGTEVVVSDTSGSWAYVTTPDGTAGWLSQNFLTPAE